MPKLTTLEQRSTRCSNECSEINLFSLTRSWHRSSVTRPWSTRKWRPQCQLLGLSGQLAHPLNWFKKLHRHLCRGDSQRSQRGRCLGRSLRLRSQARPVRSWLRVQTARPGSSFASQQVARPQLFDPSSRVALWLQKCALPSNSNTSHPNARCATCLGRPLHRLRHRGFGRRRGPSLSLHQARTTRHGCKIRVMRMCGCIW
mmetsp:Transcript_65739/g.174238  ORF Transcript_65739/g.174238 Transcript_65739/m.174238 type:complete len:201 (+) Transcript_65739:480-1082(+)